MWLKIKRSEGQTAGFFFHVSTYRSGHPFWDFFSGSLEQPGDEADQLLVQDPRDGGGRRWFKR